MQIIDVAILGATGYTGAELIRLLDGHPHFRIAHLAAHSQAGKVAGTVLPGLHDALAAQTLAHIDDPLPEGCRLAFTALPHAAAAETVARLVRNGCRVVDLSADFRHASAATYRQAYGIEHPHPELLERAVYGLTEWSRDRLREATLVANPGCYPTSVLLPLIPLLRAGVLDQGPIIVDAKSGASGAGRSAKSELLFCELNESLKAYGLPRHRHAWEMEEWLAGFGGQTVEVRFVPHILPMNRGMLTTLHLDGHAPERWRELLQQAYAGAPFVRILPDGQLPSTAGVAGSNRCDIGIGVVGERQAVIVSCIDNLLKGAAGQAVQNANAMFGFDEAAGLPRLAVWP